MMLTENSKSIIKAHLPESKRLKEVTDLFAMFADKTRLKIMTALVISSMSVTDLSGILSMNQSTVSHQLRTLRSADVVSTERRGKVVIYSLASGMNKLLEEGFLQKC